MTGDRQALFPRSADDLKARIREGFTVVVNRQAVFQPSAEALRGRIWERSTVVVK